MDDLDPEIDREVLKRAPHKLIELTTTQKFSFEREDLEDIQLAALAKRFSDLSGHIPVLRRFAEDQHLSEIRTIEDAALLLFPHTIYKSYSLSALENSRFDAMTRWVGTLTSIDVSSVDVSDCTNIDDWIAALDAQTEIRVRHSSGTTGKLSFIPASTYEAYSTIAGMRRFFEGFGDEPDAEVADIDGLPMVCFCHRRGAMAVSRALDSYLLYLYGGDESKLYCMHPGRISADMLSLGGRLEGAASKGEVGQVQLSATLLARRDEFMREQANSPRYLTEFYERVSDELRGKRVILNGIVPPTAETAIEGVKRGYERLFSPESFFFQAGGNKGRALPTDYREQVERFTGVAYPRTGYGMSEAASAITRLCPHGHYHIQPNLVPYLLDPDTGALFPRTGIQTGRFGLIDVGTQTRWGGFLTGDEITLNWGDKTPCKCGRKGAYIMGEIRRYSELRGGDDKITCAGSASVHDKALELITQLTN